MYTSPLKEPHNVKRVNKISVYTINKSYCMEDI